MTPTRSGLTSVAETTLYLSVELGKQWWHLGMTSGLRVAPVVRRVPGGDLAAVERAVAEGRRQLGLPATGRVVSCYEAGRDGFWVHRALTARGFANRVVDSSSIEVNRRARRTKTDRIDARKLVLLLVRACLGDPHVWREVRVPSAAVEGARHESRERTGLRAEQTRLTNQIGSWLATLGCRVSARAQQGVAWWTRARDWQDAALPAAVQARLARATARLTLIAQQLGTIEEGQAATTQAAGADTARGRLVRLKGVATTSAAVLLDEGLEWRAFQNRRQIGGFLGVAPARWESGGLVRDQGIGRAGNARLKAISLQLAWNWVRWQRESAITRWYQAHFGERRRARRIGIVAVARKLIIALWRYVTTGVPPAGALLKPVTVE